MGLSSKPGDSWSLKAETFFAVLIVIHHFKISLSQSHLILFVVILKLKLKNLESEAEKTAYHLLFQGLSLKSYLL